MNKKIGSRNFGKNVYKWKKNLIWLTFLLPTFICLLILTYIPTIKAVNYSFHDVNVIGEIQSNVGFQNYKVLLESSGFRKSILNTLILALMSLLAIPLGFVIACGANGVRNKKAQTVFRLGFYMPNIITASSVAVLFLALCAQKGTVNQILNGMGFESVDFINTTKARGVVMFIQTWMWFGNTMIMLMSGIMGISPSLFEAADIDGASSSQTFWRITLPLLSPIMVYTVVTSMIGGLQMFDIPFLFHNGTEVNDEIRTIAVYILQKYKNKNGYQFGYAGAASVLLFFVTIILGSITFAFNRDKDEAAKRKQRRMLVKQAKAKNKQFGGLSI